MTSNETIYKQVNDLRRLYVTRTDKYIVQLENGNYLNSSKFNQYKELDNYKIYKHLIGEKTIGIFSPEGASKVIIFDIDMKDKKDSYRHKCVRHIESVVKSLGLHESNYAVNLSGSKGYHFVIFLNGFIQNWKIVKLYDYIRHTGNYSKSEIELRPTGRMGVKLPLGIHRVTGVKCDFVDGSFNIIKDPLYLSSKIEFPKKYFEEEVDSIMYEEDIDFQTDSRQVSVENRNKILKITSNHIEKLIGSGLVENSTRHNSCVKIAIYYNTFGVSKDKCMELLDNFMSRQDKKYYKSTWKEIKEDHVKILEWVYKNNVLLKAKSNDIQFYKEELEYISSFKTKSEKLIAFSFIFHGKNFSENNKSFFLTYHQIQKYSGVIRKNIISNVLKKLIEDDILIIVSKGNWYTKSTYLYNGIHNVSDLLTINKYSFEHSNMFKEIYNSAYTTKELKSVFTRRQYQSLLL